MRKTILYTKRTYNILGFLALVFITILIINMIENQSWFGAFICASLILVNLRYWLSLPQSIVLEGNVIKESYLFSQKKFKASEIETININRRIVDFGRGPRGHSFIDVQIKSGYVISMEYFSTEIPDRYEILQGWHKKYK